jgi:hypothetical protein
MRHTPDWGQTPTGKRYAVCSCGFRAPARAKLTHGLSDIRDHFAEVKREAAEKGWHPVVVGNGLAFSTEPMVVEVSTDPAPFRRRQGLVPRTPGSRASRKRNSRLLGG